MYCAATIQVVPSMVYSRKKSLVFLEGEDVGPELDLDLSEEGNLGGQVPREDGGSVSLLVAETGGSATPAEGVIPTVRRRSGVKPGVGDPINKISPAAEAAAQAAVQAALSRRGAFMGGAPIGGRGTVTGPG